ncbi:hypothetical protein N5D48_01040 [Pseudomonas sp. GD03858]|uniref:hypothetical protein n=1 Tax=unclassified Pseudomonas TaxID=196821 RepID=UPI0024496936|nr:MULTISPECIES: hypothetical protein [unclassified Pseudomonas]MDH0645356.1 hypothetical protein [Pseudomonas sp. GD03867]MDH0660978.1 hypothetical protein [Pseudomonas sp. GD03858]
MKRHSFLLSRLLAILPLLVAVITQTGCSLLLRQADEMVESNFPPITHAEAKREAVSRSDAQLATIQSPGLLFNIPRAALSEAVAHSLSTFNSGELRVLSAEVAPDEQGLTVTAEVEGSMAEPGGTFRARLKGWSVLSISGQTASIQPILESAELTSLSLDRWWTPDRVIANTINALLARYISNVNGQIKPLEYPIDQAATGLPASPVPITLPDGRVVVVPSVRLGPIAVLVDDSGVHLFGQVDVPGTVKKTEILPTSNSFEAYRSAFWSKSAVIRSGERRSDAGLFLSDALLERLLKPSFTPIKLEDLQQTALAQTLFSLRSFGDVAAGALVSSRTLLDGIHAGLVEALKDTEDTDFGEPVVQLGEQTVSVTLPVKGVIKGANLNYQGTVQGGGVLASQDGKLYYRLVVGSITLQHLEHVGGPISIQPFVTSVNDVVAQLLPYINSALVEKPISLPLPDLAPVAVSTGNIKVRPETLVPAKPGALLLIPRISPEGIKVLVLEAPELQDQVLGYDYAVPNIAISQAVETVSKAALAAEKRDIGVFVGITPSMVDQAFKARWETTLPPYSLPDAQVAELLGTVSLRWVTSLINRTLKQNNISIAGHVDSGSIPYDSGKLRLTGDLQASCAADKECRRTNDCRLRSCSRNSCNYDCRRGLPFGGSWDDPVCKASEALCNVREEAQRGACNIQATAEKAACDVAEETKLAACNTLRELEKLGCNIVNEAIRAIQKLDGIGSISGSARVLADASITEPTLDYDPNKATMTLQMLPSVALEMSGDLHFQPYEIGHVLVCPTPGTVPFHLNGALLGARTTIVGHVAPADASLGDHLDLNISFDPIQVTGQLSPGPLEALLVQNPHVFVTCNPVLTGALGSATILGKISAFTPLDIVGAIERAVPGNQEETSKMLKMVTSGRVNQQIEIPPMSVNVPSISADLLGKSIKLSPRWSRNQLIMEQR